MIVLYYLICLIVCGVVNLLADMLPYLLKKISTPNCPACGQPRSAIQSLAVIAFLFGKRKCPSCGRPIAVRNLIVELSLAALFALLYNFYSDQLIKLVLASFFTSVLLLVTVTDFEHRLIPDRAILPAIVIAALVSPLWFGPGWYYALVGGAIGYGFFWLAVQLGDRFLGRGAMGWGDVKLAAFVGLITGFPGIITALVVTIIAGGVISLFLLLTRIVNLRSGIPYGPFICLGGFITMLYGQQIMTRFFFGS
ncbi:MAG: prepilin peptidase [Chloroflexi bacterium]|nr:prepilin peptidase [Chloroflexota bacterium]